MGVTDAQQGRSPGQGARSEARAACRAPSPLGFLDPSVGLVPSEVFPNPEKPGASEVRLPAALPPKEEGNPRERLLADGSAVRAPLLTACIPS